jgi:hypothetical protein
MRRTRRVWCKAAGLLLAATAAGPVLAQGGRGTKPLADDATPRVLPSGKPSGVEVLPAPKVVDEPAPQAQPAPAHSPTVLPATQGCGPGCGVKGAAYPSQRWLDEKHAACQAHFWGYPAEFEAPPLGAAMHAHFHTMVANGEAAAMVLYHCDFVCGTSTLNLHGRDQLTRIACMAAGNAAPIVIERTPDAPGLAEARRAAVLNILALNNVPVPPQRVLIGPPIANGLSGVDAMQLYFYSLRNTATQAAPLPIPASGSGVGLSGGGTGGGGFGGGFGGR